MHLRWTRTPDGAKATPIPSSYLPGEECIADIHVRHERLVTIQRVDGTPSSMHPLPRPELWWQVLPGRFGVALPRDRLDHLAVITPSPALLRDPVRKQWLDTRPLGITQRHARTTIGYSERRGVADSGFGGAAAARAQGSIPPPRPAPSPYFHAAAPAHPAGSNLPAVSREPQDARRRSCH